MAGRTNQEDSALLILGRLLEDAMRDTRKQDLKIAELSMRNASLEKDLEELREDFDEFVTKATPELTLADERQYKVKLAEIFSNTTVRIVTAILASAGVIAGAIKLLSTLQK